MKWLLLISFLGSPEYQFSLGQYEYERIPFATEEECMAAAGDFVKANPGFQWVDGPEVFDAVIRSTVECVGAGEG